MINIVVSGPLKHSWLQHRPTMRTQWFHCVHVATTLPQPTTFPEKYRRVSINQFKNMAIEYQLIDKKRNKWVHRTLWTLWSMDPYNTVGCNRVVATWIQWIFTMFTLLPRCRNQLCLLRNIDIHQLKIRSLYSYSYMKNVYQDGCNNAVSTQTRRIIVVFVSPQCRRKHD